MGDRVSIATARARLIATLVLASSLFSAVPCLAYLSKSESNRQQPTEIPLSSPPAEANPFDGRWIFTGAGCRGAGPVSAVIKAGKVIVRGGGGQVTPDGVIHTVGAGNGMTLTAEGRLSGDTGSGTYDRSDGCSGTWIGVRKRR